MMVLPWLLRKTGKKSSAVSGKQKKDSNEVLIPDSYRCPISLELMKDPVTVSTGITYDRASIERWLEMGNVTCPVTNENLSNVDVIPNHSMRKIIQDWCVANRSLGIERIPTPKVPVTPVQAFEILSEIAEVSNRKENAKIRQLVVRFKSLVNESEKNRKCFASNAACSVLAASFAGFASKDHVSKMDMLKEILSALLLVLPLDEKAIHYIGQSESLNELYLILEQGDVTTKLHVLLVLKELFASNAKYIDAMTKTEGLMEQFIRLIKEQISPQITKASLVTIFYMVSSNESKAKKCVDLFMIPLLLDILIEPEKSLSEKALAVFDELLSCEAGRNNARENALSVPALVKKMFRISDLATEFAVSALSKLCKNTNGDGVEECLVEALQVGAFQKLLLLLQVGCGEETKLKTTELLKLLNGFRGRADCIESVDFKGLKRPF